MIAIVNIGDNPKLTGEHLYSVRINTRELFQFRHKREEPLSRCFEKAMNAAKFYEAKQIEEIIKLTGNK